MTEETQVPPPPPAPPEEKKDATALLQKELSEFKDKYFRALAEIENSRKRLQKEKLESQSFAIQNVIVDFLQPVDHFEVALKHAKGAKEEIRHWAQGFEMILEQMKQVLSDHGAEPFNSLGEPFDPHKHEALETEERKDSPPGIVIEEYVKGYRLAGRVIRAAKVKVSTGPVEPQGNDAANQEKQLDEGASV
jgi:molecular chaperone GrpE